MGTIFFSKVLLQSSTKIFETKQQIFRKIDFQKMYTTSYSSFQEENKSENFLLELQSVIQDRKAKPTEKSYTTSLFKKGINKIAQKVGEEAVELVIEAKDDDKDLFLGEAADLMFHYLVLLSAKNFELEDVINVLRQRHAKN